MLHPIFFPIVHMLRKCNGNLILVWYNLTRLFTILTAFIRPMLFLYIWQIVCYYSILHGVYLLDTLKSSLFLCFFVCVIYPNSYTVQPTDAVHVFIELMRFYNQVKHWLEYLSIKCPNIYWVQQCQMWIEPIALLLFVVHSLNCLSFIVKN